MFVASRAQRAVLDNWVQANAAWLGYVVMALLGGAIAHIQAFEKAPEAWTAGKHVGGLAVAWTKAFFIAVIIFYLGQEFRLSQPLCFVATGVFAVFASDAILWLYNLIKRRVDPTGRHDGA